ncbi:MAG: hypothetical protein AAF533_29830, partial [Acidobacteriota bacterium]
MPTYNDSRLPAPGRSRHRSDRSKTPRPSATLTLAVLLSSLLLSFTSPPLAEAQVVSNPNWIRGEVRLTNTNPEILAFLQADTIGSKGLTLESFAMTPASPTRTRLGLGDDEVWLPVPYQLPVESSPTGIRHEVWVTVDPGNAQVHLPPLESEPVLQLPADPVDLDFEACLGLVRIRFIDRDGNPARVDWSEVEAMTSGRLTSSGNVVGRSLFELPVLGDRHHSISVEARVGSDRELDTLTVLRSASFDVSCDEVVEWPELIELPTTCRDGGCSGGGPDDPSGLSRVVGRLDIVGETEHFLLDTSELRLEDGPDGNQRWSSFTADGSFELPNIVASDWGTPASDYQARVDLSVGTGWRFQELDLPPFDIALHSGIEIDMGELALRPRYLDGGVELLGPSFDAGDHPFDHLVHPAVEDGGPVPEGRIYFTRTSVRTSSRDEAGVIGLIEGERVPGEDRYLGAFELALLNLDGETDHWTRPSLTFSFDPPG